MKILGVIPARLGSTRLQEKVLKPIAGRPMILHVYERAKKARRLSDVIVACDDPRIEACVKAAGGKAILTRQDHPNGTSRISEVAEREKADIYLNIQGDEPLIHPGNIDALAEALLSDSEVNVVTLAVKKTDPADYSNPNVVKVVCDEQGNALYFSRAPIPHFRDAEQARFSYLKHLGIYGYRRPFLLEFVRWKAGSLEQSEKLEQLRILERGFKLRVVIVQYDSVSVDTAQDLEEVQKQILR